jgi:endonuclease/exonuclease/phosphatase family metal-dependent hydrolase
MSFCKRIIVISFLLLIILNRLDAQQDAPKQLRFMFYNVENFFDTEDDSLTDDNSFLPDGVMRWNHTRYEKKLNSLYKTVIAAGEWEPPAAAAFCEIESRKILEDLIYGTYLSKFGYRIIHEDSPDRRGIDVCLIYNKELKVLYYKYWVPEITDFKSRTVLYAKLMAGGDTMHLIVNHWPSRRGGVLANEDNRIRIASMIRGKADSIMGSDKNAARIVFMGDFNCTPDDPVIRTLISSSDKEKILVNLSDSLKGNHSGTYRYQGTWEMIDQVIVSKALLYSEKGINTNAGMLKIMQSDFLLQKDPKYPGVSPFSTYRGYRYQGGFSDHLPVLLDLKVRE